MHCTFTCHTNNLLCVLLLWGINKLVRKLGYCELKYLLILLTYFFVLERQLFELVMALIQLFILSQFLLKATISMLNPLKWMVDEGRENFSDACFSKGVFPSFAKPCSRWCSHVSSELCSRWPAKPEAIVIKLSKCAANLDSLQVEFESCHHTETFGSVSHIL